MHRIVLERKGHEIAKSLSEKYITQWKISALSVLGVSRAMVEPDVELRGRGVLMYLPCWRFSLLSFLLFPPKIMGGGGVGGTWPPGPLP